MKQFFTLLTAIVLFTSNSSAQNVSQSFDTQGEVDGLVFACWNFNNVNFTGTTPLSNTGSVVGTLGSMSEISTPELQIPSTLTISFNYTTVASVSGSKTLKIFIMIDSNKTLLESINLNGGGASGSFTASYTNANTPGNNINGNRKIIIEVNNNAAVKIDDLNINAPYTHAGGCAPSNVILPIKLLSFSGSLSGNKAQLKWSVGDNETGDHFEIERSVDGRSFNSTGVVFVSTKAGTENYSYADANEINGATYYRLKIVNKNNSITYSKIIMLKNDKAATSNGIVVLQNPVASTLTFNYNATTTGNFNVNIYNINGAKVYTNNFNGHTGANSLSFNLDNKLSRGTYVLEVSNGVERAVSKLIKQ